MTLLKKIKIEKITSKNPKRKTLTKLQYCSEVQNNKLNKHLSFHVEKVQILYDSNSGVARMWAARGGP